MIPAKYCNQNKIALLGVPAECGARHRGPAMGPQALRQAGIAEMLARRGHDVEDRGDLAPAVVSGAQAQNPQIWKLDEAAGWARRLIPAAEAVLHENTLPVWLGGDHSLSLGTIAGAAAYAKSAGRKLFVLWLDAHPDFNTFETTLTGNIHGVPAAFFCGLPGFDALLGRPLAATVDPADILMLGIRSVDDAEGELLAKHGARVHDVGDIRSRGVARLLTPFLDEVAEAGGLLHVSLDVDFLDPAIAPATGTAVAGGATVAEAQEIVELVCESRLLTSLDIVELNPMMKEGQPTAALMADLAARLLGRKAARRSQFRKSRLSALSRKGLAA